MSAKLQRVGAEVERHLNEIAMLFKPGAKLTLLVRQDMPGLDADFVMTSDSLPLAMIALRKRHDLDTAPTTAPQS